MRGAVQLQSATGKKAVGRTVGGPCGCHKSKPGLVPALSADAAKLTSPAQWTASVTITFASLIKN